jgi:regulator of sigma E protease
MSLIQTLLAFFGAIGTLVVIHELGHYLVARWCGVKVLRFSVGMGKVVWMRRFGPDQTEWALSALPLGGYVKMLDGRETDVSGLPPEDLKREFTRQNVWKRIAIVAAGPVANFLLAIVLYAALFMNGVQEVSTRIADPAPGSAAERAGLDAGDIVTAIKGEAVSGWSELRWGLIEATLDKEDTTVTVRREGRGEFTFTLPAAAFNKLDIEQDVPGALGFAISLPPPVLNKVAPGGPGAAAGLQPGDQVTHVDGKQLRDSAAFLHAVRGAPGRTLQLDVLRQGAAVTLSITPRAEQQKTGKDSVTIGKIQVELAGQPDMIVVAAGPLESLHKATKKVWDTSVLTVQMFGRMIMGEVSWKNVTGPITIADYAGQTARVGLASYLSFIAFISISIGVLNLLPIPVLDGGHLLYYSLEVLTGRPVPERFGEIAQRLGVGLLVTLMALAVFNDVVRLL